jgi:hypothetical protein
MSRTLADLRASKPASRPERSLTVCLRPELVAEVQALTSELESLPVPPRSVESDDEERDGRPKRQGEGRDPRALEIQERLSSLLAEMAEHEGELRVRAISDGEWRRWVNEHPPRDEGKPGHQRDQEVAFGYCNADALIDALGRFAYTWNGEPLAEGDWKEHLEPRLGSPDLKQSATAVVAMHESRLDFRQWRSGLSASLRTLTDSDSPATSASVPDDSMAGSPEPSSAATTATASPAP